MKKFLIPILTFTSISFAFTQKEINEACNAYVSILDSCDLDTSNCEAVGKKLEENLLKQKVSEKTAKHFYTQCIKVCNLPSGKYQKIRNDIFSTCVKSLNE